MLPRLGRVATPEEGVLRIKAILKYAVLVDDDANYATLVAQMIRFITALPDTTHLSTRNYWGDPADKKGAVSLFISKGSDEPDGPALIRVVFVNQSLDDFNCDR